jgi:hypothetical protein
LNAGVRRLNRLSPDDLLAFTARCGADVLNSFVIDEARKEFEGVRESVFVDRNNTTYHQLNGCILWYKQLGSDHLPSNIPTLTAEQMMQGQFDFMPNQLLVVVGFELDLFKKKLKSVEIMRFGPGQRLEFTIEIVQVPVETRVVEMPGKPATPKVRRTKVAIRNGFEQKAFGTGEE